MKLIKKRNKQEHIVTKSFGQQKNRGGEIKEVATAEMYSSGPDEIASTKSTNG
jgi:hypothetical protein